MIRNPVTLRGRLLAIVLLTTVSALACALLTNVAANSWAFHRQNLLDLETQAELVGRMTGPALAFDDPTLARDNLSLFELRPQVRAAALYDASGKLFASYRAATRPGSVPLFAETAVTRLKGGYVEVFKPIMSNKAVVGTVHLQVDSGVAAAFLRGSMAAVLAGLLAMALAWLLLRRLLPIVTEPIAAMSSVARRVVDERDYSRRVVKMDDDEVGGLVDAFNAMLAEVETRTVQLRESLANLQREAEDRRIAQVEVEHLNEQLEHRVTARTEELQRSNQALIKAKAAADEASQVKSNFLATMSHEIRTPMNGVIGMIDILHQSSLRADQLEMADLIRESGLSLLSIIDDILDFSKIEAGRMEVELVPIDIGEVVEGACNMLSHVASRKGVELCLFTDPAIPSPVLGDPFRLRQVVVNLVGNAIKFSAGQDHTGRVQVRAELQQETGRQVRLVIRVIDNGVGMDPTTQHRLFTAFSQSDSSTTRRYGGSGLGLAISHRLAEMMGAELTVSSQLGKGAAFTLSLGLDRPDGAVCWDAPAPLPCIREVACVLVGQGGLIPDLEVYLDASGCLVHAVADVDAAVAHLLATPAISPVVVIDAHDIDPLIAGTPWIARLLDHSKGIIAIRNNVRRQWTHSQPKYLEIDGAALTRRTLVCNVEAMANGRTPGEVQTEPVRPTRVLPQSREVALQQKRLILVAEDNEFNQQVILRQLNLLGYAADIAPNGDEAFERWLAVPYGLILTDLHMPAMDGYELTAKIRQSPSHRCDVPIIALTANALKGESDRCRSAGMNSYLSKPILLETLETELVRWLPVGPGSVTSDPASAYLPITPGVLESYVGDDQHAVRTFLERFEATARDIAMQLADACVRGDVDTVFIQAHSLKSAARMAGATAIADLCEAAEVLARDGDRDALQPVIRELQAGVECLRAHLASTRIVPTA